MSVTARFRSDAFEAIHASASAMLKIGTIDKATMGRFDETCLAVPVVAMDGPPARRGKETVPHSRQGRRLARE